MSQKLKIPRQNFLTLKPQQIKLLLPTPSTSLQKQNLRDLIMDYIIQNLYQENHKQKLHKKKTGKNFENGLKNVPFTMLLQINGQKKQILLNGLVILQKYIEFEQKNLYKQHNIEPLVVDILNFFDQMQEIAENINFQLQQNNSNIQQNVVRVLLDKYHKDKQRLKRMKQLETIKNKTIAKYTRVSYLDIENNLQKKQFQVFVEKSFQNSHRISRETIFSENDDKLSTYTNDVGGQTSKPTRSRLSDLVDKYKIFQHPQKIQQLRKEKLNEVYTSKMVEDIGFKQKLQQKQRVEANGGGQKNTSQASLTNNNIKALSGHGKKFHTVFNQDCIGFLQSWITELSISQKLYKSRFESSTSSTSSSMNNTGNKQAKTVPANLSTSNQAKIKIEGKIIEQSSDDEEEESQFTSKSSITTIPLEQI